MSDLPDYQQRVVDELGELCNKLEKLLAFMESDAFENISFVQRELMIDQRVAMERYAGILESRLANWGIDL